MSKGIKQQKAASAMSKSKGFTILEVLIAMAILALSGAAIVRMTGENIAAITLLKQITFSSWVAENRLVEIQLEADWPPKNNKRGEAEMAGDTWYWQQKVEKVADPAMRRVTVLVFAQQDDNEAAYELSAFLGNSK